jgi:hypothetical protein
VSLPINFLGRDLARATLKIVAPAESKRTIKLHFNPEKYKLSRTNTFAEIAIPGLETPPIQYVRGGSRTLTMELYVDTTDTLEDVHSKYVSDIEGLMKKNEKLHAPPIVSFFWAEDVFTGVMQTLDINYLLFHIDGKPLRAQLTVTLKEYRPEASKEDAKQTSPDVEKRYVVRAGETISSISAAVFRDPADWREIALANGIVDPRHLDPGTVLTIPQLASRRP